MRILLAAVVFTAAAVVGQKNPEPVVSPLPDHLTIVQPDAIRQPMVGQMAEQVSALLGKPDGIDHLHNRKQGNFIWYYRPDSHDTLMLTFVGEKVKRIKTFNSSSDAHPPRNLDRSVGIALDIATRVAFVNVCPKVYRLPVLFMNANELQWLQACNASGFMLFGLYVYTGPQQ